MTERFVFVHYHLFKNAGTSLDKILQDNFGSQWVTAEFPRQRGNNSDLVADWIRATPEARVYSSHTAIGPLPQVEGVRIFPILLLRDPIDRIVSGYKFERRQKTEKWEALLAKAHDLEGYARARLERPTDRQCRNFQTRRLSAFLPGPEPELDRALHALKMLDGCGLVERFDDAMTRLATVMQDHRPGFAWSPTRANATKSGDKAVLSDSFRAELEQINADDLALLDQASRVWA